MPMFCALALRWAPVSLGVLLTLALLLGCGGSEGNGPTTPPDPPRPTTLSVSPATVELTSIGETVQLTASVLDQHGQVISTAPVSWFCRPASVASVTPSGLVTAEGIGNASVTATSGSAQNAAAITVVVDPPSIVTTTLQPATVGIEVERVLNATGGDGNYAWALVAGALPGGLTLSPDGKISGTPLEAGDYQFTVEVQSAGRTGTKEFTLTINNLPIWISTKALPSAVVGAAYDFELTAKGGDGTYAWTISGGSLPDGLNLSQDGTVSGQPATQGTFSFTIQVASGGQDSSKSLSITVVSADLGVTLDTLQFSLIPAGTFEMGSWDGWSNERPVHTVTLTQSFYIQKTEVTQGQWRTVMGDNPSWFSDCGDTCPIETVSWYEVQEFIARLNDAQPGMNYRLPSEAEWEYAAKAGRTGDYGVSGSIDGFAWYGGNSGNRTHPVAQKTPNAWGLFDMHGNAAEWVQDWFSSDYYSDSPEMDPPGPSSGTYKVLRGGACWYSAFAIRAAYRRYTYPEYRDSARGFRLARTP